MKKLIIGIAGGVSTIAVAGFVVGIAATTKNKNTAANSEADSKIEKLTFKNGLLAEDFNLIDKTSLESRKLITKDWVVNNKTKLFIDNSYLGQLKVSDIKTIDVQDGDSDLLISINKGLGKGNWEVEGKINGFFSKKTELFNVNKYEVPSGKFVNTHSFEINGITEAAAQYLSNVKNPEIKATAENGIISWNLDVSSSDEIKNMFASKIFSKAWQQLANNNRILQVATKVKLSYEITKIDPSSSNAEYTIKPLEFKIETAKYGTKTLAFSLANQQATAFNIKFLNLSYKGVGEIVESPKIVPEILEAVDKKLDFEKDLGVNIARNWDAIGQEIANSKWVYSKKDKLFKKPDLLQDISFIESVTYNKQFATSSIQLVITWVGYPEENQKSAVNIYFDQNSLLKLTDLGSLNIWSDTTGTKSIERHLASDVSEIRANVIDYIDEQQNKIFGQGGLKAKPKSNTKDIFYMSINEDSNGENANDTIAFENFKRWWKWQDGYPSWAAKNESLGIIPNVSKLKTIKVEFKVNLTFEGDSNSYLTFEVIPQSVTFEYRSAFYGPTFSWSFSGELQQLNTSKFKYSLT